MNTKIIVYNKEYIHNYDALKQLCLMMNIEIILINNQMTQNKIKDLLNNKIKKSKKKKLEYKLSKILRFIFLLTAHNTTANAKQTKILRSVFDNG